MVVPTSNHLKSALEKPVNLKLTLEKYYQTLLQQSVERQERFNPAFVIPQFCLYRLSHFEDSVRDFPDEIKSEQVKRYLAREAEYMRSKRIKLTLNDFRTLQTIGKGAFGTVFGKLDLC